MRKILLSFLLTVAISMAYSQQVPRQMVVVEIATGTWCQYCPGAAMGADDLIANGYNCAIVENHNGDSFANTGSDSRNTYYGVTGYPTAKFDGTLSYVGGSNTSSMYSNYVPLVNQRNAVLSSFHIDIAGSNIGNNYNIVLNVNKVADYSGTNLVVHLVLTESEIAYSWQGQTELNYVNRQMSPTYNGTPVSFTSGSLQVLNISFTKDASWVTDHCELVAFIQDNTTKEILQGEKVALNALAPSMAVNFTASQTSFCGPETVTYTDQSAGATAWNWSFPGGNPATSTVQNPTVTYSTAGVYDVTLQASNATSGGVMVKDDYITVTAVPPAAGNINGPTGLCQDPANTSYTVGSISTATSYEWALTPSTAGVVNAGSTTVSIDWDAAFTGACVLKVRGVNSCGEGAWSPALSISVDLEPTQAATPTGPTSLCMNAENTEYSTTGATNVTEYLWAISPVSAGTISTFWTTGTVDWDPAFTGTASITVKGINGGCEGPSSNPILVTVNPGPVAYNVTGGGTACEGTAGVGVGLDDSENGINYSMMIDGVVTGSPVPGTGNAISFGNQTTAGTYTVKAASSGCENTMSGSAVVVVKDVPTIPSTPSGPEAVVVQPGMQTPFSTTSVAGADSYEWNIEPADAGAMVGSEITANAVWGNTWFYDNALITVKAKNECGTSSVSEAHSVAVQNFVGVESPATGQLRVYPNPASDFVTVENSGSEPSSVKFYNLAGQQVKEVRLNSGEKANIEVSQLGSGVYQMIITEGQKTRTARLVVE